MSSYTAKRSSEIQERISENADLRSEVTDALSDLDDTDIYDNDWGDW